VGRHHFGGDTQGVSLMRREPRRRFWVELTFTLVAGALLAVTLVRHDWIELIFGVDPDEGNGMLEWIVVGADVILTVAFGLAARLEWRRRAVVNA
jgi:hypothetical protein